MRSFTDNEVRKFESMLVRDLPIYHVFAPPIAWHDRNYSSAYK